ncbi:TRAP transporter large permease [Arenibaculum pallidiluteum]|uniref:TRAP transporter large permease n=1 Tax=Arenibaculum pallidiluteum TaxID=2812559 RepID=UPI001A970483|nr:TRAP transporter large permease [Arenibaculum pallidiluteum]
MTATLIGFAALLVLMGLRVPIAFAMGLVGYVGFGLLVSWTAAASMVATTAYETGLTYSLAVVPLFILMGNLVTQAGLSGELYAASYALLGHRRGGLAMATVLACAGFSSICGSSLATAATMAKVSMPSMRKYGYSMELATGSIASGGTLGILIPPSVVMIIYGLMTEQDIGKLFVAGLLPGAVAVLCYLGAIAFVTWRDPKAGPPGARMSWPERLQAFKGIWGIVTLFLVVIGGIYGGIFTPNEAAGIGAAGALAFTLLRGKMTWRILFNVLAESARTTAMIFSILIGALVFSNMINMTQAPTVLTEWIVAQGFSPMLVIFVIVGIYFILGCLLESLSMILLTVPVFYPVIAALDFGAMMDPQLVLIWFGIIVVVVTEISLITPPVGLNVFVIRAVLPEVTTGTIFRGVTPFWVADLIRITILILVPGISLLLPSLMR